MQTKTNYPGSPHGGEREFRRLTGVVGGLVIGLTTVAVAAPSVTITERSAGKPAGKGAPVTLEAARRTPKAPKLAADARPTGFILQTAQRRLTQVASKDDVPPAAPASGTCRTAPRGP